MPATVEAPAKSAAPDQPMDVQTRAASEIEDDVYSALFGQQDAAAAEPKPARKGKPQSTSGKQPGSQSPDDSAGSASAPGSLADALRDTEADDEPDLADYSPEISGEQTDPQADDTDDDDETDDTQDPSDQSDQSDSEEDEEPSHEWDEATQAAFDLVKTREKEKRAKLSEKLDRATADLEAARKDAAEAASLREQLAGEVRPAPMPDNPLADVFSEKALAERVTEARNEALTAEKLLHKLMRGQVEEVAEVVAKVAPTVGRDEDALEEWLVERRAENSAIVTEHVHTRRQFLKDMQQADQLAAQIIPELKEDDFRKEITGIIASAPWVKLSSNHKILAAAQVFGMREIVRRFQAARNASGAPRRPAKAKPSKPSRSAGPSPSAAPAAPRGRVRDKGEAAKARFDQSGSEADLAGAIEAML